MAKATVMKPVDSSLFAEVGYNDDNWTLSVRFRSNGLLLTYQEISPEFADEFLSAKSIGRFYSDNIKGKFKAIGEVPGEIDPSSVQSGKIVQTPEGTKLEPFTEGDVFEGPVKVSSPVARNAGDIKTTRPISVAEAEQFKAAIEGTAVQPIGALDPQEAIALPQKKAVEIESVIERGKKDAASALNIKVVDQLSYAAAGQALKALQIARDSAFSFLDPIRDAIYKAYTLAQRKQKEALDPIDAAIVYVKKAMLQYTEKQEEIRLQKIREANARAEEEARVRQQELSQKMTLDEISDAIQSGDTTRAEDLFANPIEVPKPHVEPEYIPPAVENLAGQSKRKNWAVRKGEGEYDLAVFLGAVKDGTLSVEVAARYILPNFPALNQQAKALEKSFNVPGFQAYNNAVLTSRR